MSTRRAKHAGDGDPIADCHPDKRIKLEDPAPIAHPFENVDYWLQFDDDQCQDTQQPSLETTTPTPITASSRSSSNSSSTLPTAATSFDGAGMFSSWGDSLDQNSGVKTAQTSLTSSPYEEKPHLMPSAYPAGIPTASDPNDFFYFGTPSPDMDDALKSMNLGDTWEAGQPRAAASSATLFPGLLPPTPDSDDAAPVSFDPAQQQPQQPQTQAPSVDAMSSLPYLGDEERMSLLSLALNLGPLPPGLLPGRDFRFDMGASGLCREAASMNGQAEKKQQAGRAATDDADAADATADKCAKGKPRVVDRAAHNDIERRYRTNLKCKIAELKEAIPTLSGEDDEGSGGEKGASKVSKGTVLTKATEYIHQLEERNKQMEIQQQALLRRLQAMEILLDPRRTLAARMGSSGAEKSESGSPAV